jgi:hypothetical protein
MDVNIAPAAAPGGHRGMQSSKKNPLPKRKRSSQPVKSKEFMEDSELDKGVGEVPEGKIEEDELMIPVDIEEQPKKKKKVDAPLINHEAVLPPVGSAIWKKLLVCEKCQMKGKDGRECIVEYPGYSCAICGKWKEECSQVPLQWNKLCRRRLTEREEMMWKVCGIGPSPSVPVKTAGRAARKASGHVAGKGIEQSSPPSTIFGPRSCQLGLKKNPKTDEEGQKSLSVINEVHECPVHQRFLTQALQEETVQAAPIPAA